MTDKESTALDDVFTGMKIGVILTILYGIYRILRPYWFASRIQDWLRAEQDYVNDFSRSLNPLGYYEFEVHLDDDGEPELFIENTSNRGAVVLRARLDFRPTTVSNLIRRSVDDQENILPNEQRQFLEEVDWALTSAPGVYWYVNHEGEPCEAPEADGVVVEYRIYPDAVSQHEILNGIVEIANALKLIRQREEKYEDRLNSGR